LLQISYIYIYKRYIKELLILVKWIKLSVKIPQKSDLKKKNSYNQGRHQGLTARTESGGPGLRGARGGAWDLGRGGNGKGGKKEKKKIKKNKGD
jgi:hypothetical protein